MSLVKPTLDHLAFRSESLELLKKHAGHLPGDVMLALHAHMLGQLIALQDQRTMTREICLKIIMMNIEKGNLEVIEQVMGSQGNA